MSAGFGTATNENSSWPNYGREWGPWKDWDGSHVLGPDDDMFDNVEAFVNVYRKSPTAEYYLVAEAHHIEWSHDDGPNDILAYRVEL
jgi:hypothetical protein